jgi:hypothetical protein
MTLSKRLWIAAAAGLSVLGLLAALSSQAHSRHPVSAVPPAAAVASLDVCLPWYGFLQVAHTCECSMALGGDGVTVSTFFSGTSKPACDGCSGALDLVLTCPDYTTASTILFNGACDAGTNRIRQYCPTAPTMQISVAEVFCLDCNEPIPQ